MGPDEGPVAYGSVEGLDDDNGSREEGDQRVTISRWCVGRSV